MILSIQYNPRSRHRLDEFYGFIFVFADEGVVACCIQKISILRA